MAVPWHWLASFSEFLEQLFKILFILDVFHKFNLMRNLKLKSKYLSFIYLYAQLDYLLYLCR